MRLSAVPAGLAALALLAPAATAAPPPRVTTLLTPGTPTSAQLVGASADGARIVFTTTTALVPTDGDLVSDAYARLADGTFRLLTPGTADPASVDAASVDGTSVLIETTEALVPADAGTRRDLYEARLDGTYVLRSAGDASASSDFESGTPDLRHIIFSSRAVVPGLGVVAGGFYCYASSPGGVRLISSGLATDQGFCAGISANGEHAWFGAEEDLDGAATGDDDAFTDLYDRRTDGSLQLVSPGTPDAGGLNVVGATPDGSVAIFTANQAPSLGDSDPNADLFAHRAAGSTVLVSSDTPALGVSFRGMSRDGSRVFFEAQDEIPGTGVEGDDVAVDVYEWRTADGALALRTPGTAAGAEFRGATRDGSRVYYSTDAAVVTSDTDGTQDIYEHRASPSATRLITGGVLDARLAFRAATDDARDVVFVSDEALLPSDPGTGTSIYARGLDGSLRLLSPPLGSAPVAFRFMTGDGARLFFEAESGVAGDTDSAFDIFQLAIPAPTATVAVAGSNAVGGVLACTASAGDSEVPVTTTRAWLRDGAPIAGATGVTFRIPATFAGHRVVCRATAASSAGTGAATREVRVRPSLVRPRITPTPARVGTLLRCRATAVGATRVTRSWSRNGRAIRRATRATYRATALDLGKRLRCKVTAANDGGPTVATSAAVKVQPRRRR